LRLFPNDWSLPAGDAPDLTEAGYNRPERDTV